jgi:hypothetical protein
MTAHVYDVIDATGYLKMTIAVNNRTIARKVET